jgi:phage shock protein A
MSLFSKIANRLKQASRDAEEKIEDPRAEINQAIVDSQKQVDQFEKALADFRVSTKQLEREAARHKANVDKWTSIAEQADAAGNESDALKALDNVGEADTALEGLTTQILANSSRVKSLKVRLAEKRGEIATAERTKTQYLARIKAAELDVSMNKASTAFGKSESPLARLGALEKMCEKKEAQAEVASDMAGEAAPDKSLEDKYTVSSGPSAAERLKALRAKKNQ